MGDRRALGGADDRSHAESEHTVRLEVHARAAAGPERAQPDLGPLQILKYGHRPAPAGLAFTNATDDLGVLLVRAVGEVEARDVQAGRREAVQLGGAAAGGTDRADD